MAEGRKRVKQQGNGSGKVYARKNKDGKNTGYLGSYFGPDGKRRYVSGKTKTEPPTSCVRLWETPTRGWSTMPVP